MSKAKQMGARQAGLWFSKKLYNQLVAKKIAASVASGICGVASAGFTILTWALDPGGQLAAYIDAHDAKGSDGYCTFF